MKLLLDVGDRTKTVARKSSIGGLCVCAAGLCVRCFSANFQSHLVARSWKPIKRILKTLFRGCKEHQILRKEHTVDFASSNNDELVDCVKGLWHSSNYSNST